MQMARCDICGESFDLREGGYLGPNDPESEACHSWKEFESVCSKCAMDPGDSNDADL